MNQAIMAHIVASITVFERIRQSCIRREGTPLQKRKDCPDALFLCRENGGQQVMFFWHLSRLTPLRLLSQLQVDY